MPLSEFYRMARGNLESSRQTTADNSTDPSHITESECLELVWENGQIVMQAQANKVRRSPSSTSFETQYQKDLGKSTNSKMGSVLTNLTTTDTPRVEMGLGQDDDDMVPWMNYPMEDYCSGLLPEISGLTVTAQNNSLSSMDKRSGLRNTSIPTSLSLEKENTPKQELGQSSKSRSSQVYPWTFQEVQELAPSPNSRIPGSSITIQPSPGGSPMSKTQKQDSALANGSSNYMNFSHFSRPIALARVKANAPSGANIAEPTNLNSKTGLVKEVCAADLAKGLKTLVARPIEESRNTNQSAIVCGHDSIKTNKMEKEIVGESAILGMPAKEKNTELVVASSSASGSSLERASNEPRHDLKRKHRETDDSEGRSEDVEESLGIRNATHPRGVGSKRGRAADVHNLSERRRRDRINEKMRALQELIPNCNKVDKASMLDEAIEYLKTLQLQVQIMSMGSGMYMPSMMVPAGMQHMHPAHMAQFSPMALGMGMNMGFGMNMMEMGGGSHALMQIPRVSGSHFAASRPPSMGFHGMAGTNLQGFGHPSQGFPIPSISHSLSMPSLQGPPVSSSRETIGNGMSVTVQAQNLAPSLDPKNFLQMINTQMTDVADGSRSANPKSNEPSSDVLEQSNLLPKENRHADVAHGEEVGTRS